MLDTAAFGRPFFISGYVIQETKAARFCAGVAANGQLCQDLGSAARTNALYGASSGRFII
jgi:hypothetical protein